MLLGGGGRVSIEVDHHESVIRSTGFYDSLFGFGGSHASALLILFSFLLPFFFYFLFPSKPATPGYDSSNEIAIKTRYDARKTNACATRSTWRDALRVTLQLVRDIKERERELEYYLHKYCFSYEILVFRSSVCPSDIERELVSSMFS